MSTNVKNLSPQKKELVLSVLYKSAKRFDEQSTVTNFINELLTESEKVTIGRRVLIAQMILSGYSQAEIMHRLGVSPNTFTRTKKWLLGQIPEYDVVIKEFELNKNNKRVRTKAKKKNYNPLTFRGMRNKYPMHFLFFNLAEEILAKLNR